MLSARHRYAAVRIRPTALCTRRQQAPAAASSTSSACCSATASSTSAAQCRHQFRFRREPGRCSMPRANQLQLGLLRPEPGYPLRLGTFGTRMNTVSPYPGQHWRIRNLKRQSAVLAGYEELFEDNGDSEHSATLDEKADRLPPDPRWQRSPHRRLLRRRGLRFSRLRRASSARAQMCAVIADSAAGAKPLETHSPSRVSAESPSKCETQELENPPTSATMPCAVSIAKMNCSRLERYREATNSTHRLRSQRRHEGDFARQQAARQHRFRPLLEPA